MDEVFIFIEYTMAVIGMATMVAILVAVIPKIISEQSKQIHVGSNVMWNDEIVYVVAQDTKTDPPTYIIRSSKGELHVLLSELNPQIERRTIQ